MISHDGPLGLPKLGVGVDLAPARCAVLVPFQGRIVSRCQAGLLELERRGYTVRRIEGYSAIDQARNQIGSDALKDGFQETLWIDSDVGFEPDDVERLRRHGLPITCGIYPKKGKRELAIHILPGTPRFRFGVQGGLHEILYGGTGFLHVRRAVYETMIQQLQLPVCNEHAQNPMWPFFQPLIRSSPSGGQLTGAVEDSDPAARDTDRNASRGATSPTTGHWYLAEDYAFCHRARLCGFPIIADTTIRLWHVGDYGYRWEDAGIDRQRYGDFDFQFEG